MSLSLLRFLHRYSFEIVCIVMGGPILALVLTWPFGGLLP